MAADREQQDALLELLNTTPVANGHAGDVVAENPAGGQAPEGSTVTITVGVRQNGR